MDVEEVLFRKYKGYAGVMYDTRKEAEYSFHYQKISPIVPLSDPSDYYSTNGFSRQEVIQIIFDNKDSLLKILQEIK